MQRNPRRPVRRSTSRMFAVLVLLCVTAAACKPATVTEARDQLKRGGARTFSLSIPVTFDSVLIQDVLPEDRDTVVNGIVGVSATDRAFQVPVVDSFTVPIPFTESDFDFGDFSDAILNSTINQAIARIAMANPTAQPVVVTDYRWGVVELNPDGSIPFDGSGAPDYQTDAGGAPVVITVTDPGDVVVTVPASGTNALDVEAPQIAEALVNLVLTGRNAAVVVTGSATGGVGFTILDGTVDFAILLDLTLPASGVVFSSNTTQSGAELDLADIDQLAERVQSATFVAVTTNRSPFASEVDVAFIAGNQGESDIFALPNHVEIAGISFTGSTVDVNGFRTAESTSTVTISITGNETRQLLGEFFTVRSRVRLIPQTANGRAVVRPGDIVVFTARANVTLQSGEDQ